MRCEGELRRRRRHEPCFIDHEFHRQLRPTIGHSMIGCPASDVVPATLKLKPHFTYSQRARRLGSRHLGECDAPPAASSKSFVRCFSNKPTLQVNSRNIPVPRVETFTFRSTMAGITLHQNYSISMKWHVYLALTAWDNLSQIRWCST